MVQIASELDTVKRTLMLAKRPVRFVEELEVARISARVFAFVFQINPKEKASGGAGQGLLYN